MVYSIYKKFLKWNVEVIKRLLIIFILIISGTNVYAAEDFTDYIKTLKLQVDKAWNAPVYYLRHTSDVYFRIHKDGTISDIKVVKSSKVPQLDKKAVTAIKNMPKQDKLPSFYSSDYIEVTVGLTNYIYEDMRNPNLYQKKKNIKQNDLIPVSTKCVKIKKVVYSESFLNGKSNYQDKMKDLVLNLEIQKALKN